MITNILEAMCIENNVLTLIEISSKSNTGAQTSKRSFGWNCVSCFDLELGCNYHVEVFFKFLKLIFIDFTKGNYNIKENIKGNG